MQLKKGWKKIIAKLSLRDKIIYFSIIVFSTFLVLISFITFNLLNKTIISSEIKYSNRNNLLIKNNYQGLIDNTENLLRVISTDPQLQDAMLALNQTENYSSVFFLNKRTIIGKSVSNVISPNTPIVGACIWGDDIYYSGYCLESEDVKPLLPYNEESLINNNQSLFWSKLSLLKYSYDDSEYVFPVTKAIIHKDFGYKLGYITLFLSEKTVSKILDLEENGTSDQQFYIVNENKIVSSTKREYINKTLKDVLPISKENYDKLFDLGYVLDKRNLYSTLQNGPDMIVSQINLSDFFEARRVQLTTVLLIVLIAIIIVAFGSYWLSITITKPLYSIIRLMEKIKKGDLSCRIEGEIPDLELNNFAHAFNRLMDRLELSIEEIYQQQQELRKSELLLIQSQIKPHFLYNSMETVSSFIQLEYYDKALQALQNLAGFYRKTLSNGRVIISVKEEIEIITYYLKLQKLRYNDYLNYTIEIEESLNDYKIPKLLLQPLVENSIYHGIKPLDKMGEIIICGYMKDNRICFEVYDTGVGINREKLEEIRSKIRQDEDTSSKESFGLMSVKRRLNIFFSEKAIFDIDSVENEYTQIFISFPKNSNRY